MGSRRKELPPLGARTPSWTMWLIMLILTSAASGGPKRLRTREHGTLQPFGSWRVMSGQVNLDTLLRPLTCYRNVTRVKTDVITCMQQVRTLIPKVERLIHNNGMESELLVLSGTIAIHYQGRQYNIPVDIYISEPYPDSPPRCYVRPTANMEIKMGHRHVDREGLVYLPYLHEWNGRMSNLLELCACMSSVFGAEPPVFASKKPQQQPGPTSAAAVGGYSSFPQARPAQQQAQQPSPYYYNGADASQRLQQPPPSYDSVARPPQPTQPYGLMYGAGGPTTGGGSTAYQQQQQVSLAQQQAQAEMKRKEAVQQVTLRLQRALQDFMTKAKAELTEEQDKQARLEEGRQQVAGSVAALKKMAEELQAQTGAMAEKEKELEAWLAEQSGKAELPVEERFEAVDAPSRQMLKLVAENAAIEDALYHLDRAVANGTVDCTTFLREVRRLSRDQFMCLAHVNKIYRQQQAQWLADRPSVAR